MRTHTGQLPQLLKAVREFGDKFFDQSHKYLGPKEQPDPKEGYIVKVAAPSDQQTSVTLRARAAIALKVPNSGLLWLDEMIKQSRQLDLEAAKQAAKGDDAS